MTYFYFDIITKLLSGSLFKEVGPFFSAFQPLAMHCSHASHVALTLAMSCYRLCASRLGFFWHASQSQIYPELSRLAVLGLVTYEPVKQDNRPDKKVYSITDEGHEALQESATAPTEPEPSLSNELLLKTYTIWLADPAKMLKLFRAQEDYHRSRLADYERIFWQASSRYTPRLFRCMNRSLVTMQLSRLAYAMNEPT